MLRRASAAASQFEIMELPWRLTSVRDAFDGDRRGFAAADAERRDPALCILRFKRMQQGHDQSRTGGPDGVTERAGAAIDVQPVAGNPEVALCRHRDHRKGLIDLEQIDVANLPADLV